MIEDAVEKIEADDNGACSVSMSEELAEYVITVLDASFHKLHKDKAHAAEVKLFSRHGRLPAPLDRFINENWGALGFI